MIRGLLLIVVVASFAGSITPFFVRSEVMAGVTRVLGACSVIVFFLVVGRIRDDRTFSGVVELDEATMRIIRFVIRFVSSVGFAVLGVLIVGLILKWSPAVLLQLRAQESPDVFLALLYLLVATFGLAFVVLGAQVWFAPASADSLPRSFRLWQRYIRKDPLAMEIIESEERERER